MPNYTSQQLLDIEWALAMECHIPPNESTPSAKVFAWYSLLVKHHKKRQEMAEKHKHGPKSVAELRGVNHAS